MADRDNNQGSQTLELIYEKGHLPKGLADALGIKDNVPPEKPKPETLEFRTDKQFPKDHPLNPDYVSPTDKALKGEAPPATGQQSSNASTSVGIELPNKNNDDKTVGNSQEELNRESKIRRILAAIGFGDKAAQDNAEKDLRENAQSSGSVPSSKDVANTVRKVTGREVGEMDSSALANAAKIGQELKNNGMIGQHQSDHLVMAAQQKSHEQGINV